MSSLSLADRAGRSFWRMFPKRAFSNVVGWSTRGTLPRGVRVALLGRFAQSYGIDLAEAECANLAEYQTFDELFTRRLKPTARPVDTSAGAVVNPADGTVVECGVIEAGEMVQAKGVRFRLADLLADVEDAAVFEGGPYLITYLSPKDYHRVHAPVAGRVIAWHYIPGTLFSVNADSIRREPGVFARNERFVTILDTEAGRCAVVMVAAVGVGHMTASYDPELATHARGFPAREVRHKTFDAGPRLDRGGEIGIFHLGSTTIVLFQPGRVSLDVLAPGSATRMGARIGRILA